MAAVSCEFCKCYCRKLSFLAKNISLNGSTRVLRSTAYYRNLSASAKQDPAETRTRKKRDRLTVLKALASTVDKVPQKPEYRFFDDVILNPRSLLKQKEFKLAMESGKKAAEYVLETHPDLFPMRHPVPAWPKSQPVTASIEESVENLQLLMQNGENVTKVVDLYEKLKSNGDLSIDVHNEMLDFVSFHSVSASSDGNSIQEQDAEVSERSSSSSSSSSSSDEEDQSTQKQHKEIQESNAKSTWRNDGYAETLFKELKETGNAMTYEAFILGLLKHEEFVRAFHVFREFNEKAFEGSLFFYNTFISHVCDVRQGDKDRWDLVQEVVACLKKCGIKPDVVTFNSLLSIAMEMDNNPQLLCHKLLREMKQLNIAPSLGSYYYILAAERKNEYQDIKVLYRTVEDLKKGVADFRLQHPADMLFFHTAMNLARFKRNGKIAKELMELVVKNGLHFMLGARSSSFYGNYLCAIARNSPNLDDVFLEYERIVPKYIVPSDWVFQQLLLAIQRLKNPEMVPKLYSDMVSMRVPVTERASTALFAAMKENIPKDRAEEFLHVAKDSAKWMKVFEVDVTPDTVSTTIKILCLCEKYEEIKQLIEDSKERGIYPSVDAMLAVLNLNLAQRDKQSALSTLKSMAEYKFQMNQDIEAIISESELLRDKSEKIHVWFAKSQRK